MKRLSICILFLCLIFTPFLDAAENESGKTAILVEKPIVQSIGFGLKASDFKVVEFSLLEVSLMANNQQQNSQAAKIVGRFSIGGVGYKLKIVKPQPENFEADIVIPSEEKGLFLPIGHLSLELSQADAKHSVMTGDLKIQIEEDESNSGVFQIYLNVKPEDVKTSQE